jgi:hypothetical protein
LLVVVVGGAVWLSMPSPEPVYQGMPLSYWLAGYDVGNYNFIHPKGPLPPTPEQANEATRQIGTNAFPALLRMLQQPNPSLIDRIWAVGQKQHFIKIPFAPANRNYKAFRAFSSLGPRASNAVPALVAIFESNLAPFPQQAVPGILGQIGPAAEAAIPALVRGLTHTNLFVRHNVIFALGQIQAQPKLVVPVLTECLNDPEAFVRAGAAQALESFGEHAQSAVPALLELRRKEALLPGPANGTAKFMISGGTVSSSWGTRPGFIVNAYVVAATMEALNRIDPGAAAAADLQ